MDHNIVAIILAMIVIVTLAAVLIVITGLENHGAASCADSSDCAGQAHKDCAGGWGCMGGRCIWHCENQTARCSAPRDCESLPHVECVGSWKCKNGRCSWECKLEGECSSDGDCVVSGCSGQVCGPKPVTTTCEWRPEYDCYKQANCACIGGRCMWEETRELRECLGAR